MSSISQRSAEVTNPLHESSRGLIVESAERNDGEGYDLETIEPDHLPAPISLTDPKHVLNKGSHDSPNTGNGGSNGNAHGGEPAPSKVPIWIQDLVEKVFKVKKRKSTIEVRVILPFLCIILSINYIT